MDTIYESERNNLVTRIKALQTSQEEKESIFMYVDKLKNTISQCHIDSIKEAKDLITTMTFTKDLSNDGIKKGGLQQHTMKPSSNFTDSINTAMGTKIIKGIDS